MKRETANVLCPPKRSEGWKRETANVNRLNLDTLLSSMLRYLIAFKKKDTPVGITSFFAYPLRLCATNIYASDFSFLGSFNVN